MPGQEQHPKLPNSCYPNKRDFSKYLGTWHTYEYRVCAKVKYEKRALQEGLQEDLEVYWLYLEDIQKQLAQFLCWQKAARAPPVTESTKKNQNVKLPQMPGAAEQMLEMRKVEPDRKVPRGAQDMVDNPSPVQLNSLLASRGFWSFPPPHPHVHNMCIHLSMCLGGSRR